MSPYIPQPGDIGLTQIGGEVGFGIRFGQWLNGDGFADYEHAFVFIGSGLLIEAEPGGARKADIREYATDTIEWLRCPPEFGPAVAAAAITYPGTPYSFLDYAAIAAHRVHIPYPQLKAYIASTGHMICSQLADAAAQAGGWHLFTDNRWVGSVTPGDLHRLYDQQEQARAQSA